MDLFDLVSRNRSFRKFDQNHPVERELLEKLVGLARLSASGANRQLLRFMVFNSKPDCGKIFPTLAWAAYLKEWPGPSEGERPTAYIIILGDKSTTEGFGVDHGIAAQSIMLGATEAGLGGCMIGSIAKDALRKAVSIPEDYAILLVVALGKPAEKVVIDPVVRGDIKYWRDSNGIHHVPKRSLDELIIN